MFSNAVDEVNSLNIPLKSEHDVYAPIKLSWQLQNWELNSEKKLMLIIKQKIAGGKVLEILAINRD